MNETTAPASTTLLNLLRLWFTSTEPVDRRTYLLSAIALVLLGFGLQAAIYYAYNGRMLGLVQHLNPMLTSKAPAPNAQHDFLGMWVLTSLPFFWVWASLSIRRSVDAGLGAYFGLLVFVPIVDWFVIAILASMSTAIEPAIDYDESPVRWWPSLLSVVLAGLLGVVAMMTSVFGIESYGGALFVATPLLQGLIVGYACGRDGASLGRAAALSQLAVVATGLLLLSIALEGAVCLVMAYPIAAAVALLGAGLGCSLGRAARVHAIQLIGILLTLPVLLGAETQRAAPPLREVVSFVEIDAPPAAIWPEVVGFGELPPISEWVFRLGIAHPIRARIEGEGVGAVRYCEFSTGPFVEPITHWEEPYRLSFDVRSQPEPMHEWSPYQHVDAPHLLHSLRSERGEFRLIPLPNGRTRLEGSTWYTLDMAPQLYWSAYSDALIHAIHMRVLDHIKLRAEQSA